MTRERVTIVPGGDSPESRRAVVERARRRGFTHFATSGESGRLDARPGEEVIVREADHLTVPTRDPPTVPLVRVGDPSSLHKLILETPRGSAIAVEWTGDRIIPLENAISEVGDRFELWVVARGPKEVSGALGALERGAHRVIVEVGSTEEVDELESVLEGPYPTGLDWSLVTVSSVRPVGLGDRVLVDTTSLLDPAEGLLVGSAAGFLFNVASEAVGSRFSRARPFRVNAGSGHSYVLMADGSTRYLTELEPGDAVLAGRPAGEVRTVRVGRVKIERRPLVVVTARVGDQDRTVFLQEAETVRLSGESGRIATTALAAGARVHGVRLPPARHLGREVEETIV